MKKIDYSYIARVLASLSGIPVRVYKNGELSDYYSLIKLPKDPLTVYMNEVSALHRHVDYYITPLFHIYGIINSGDVRIVIGPTAQIFANDQSLKELAFKADVSKEDVQSFVEGTKSIVSMPLESLLMMLCSVNYMLNNEKLELKDILIRNDEQQTIKKNVEHQRTENVYNSEPAQALHNTLQLEETLMDIVRRGDISALTQWISAAPSVRAGLIAPDQLRQLKNTFIVTATLTTRAAIRGGMDAEDALTLSDAYIRRMELLSSQSSIMNLQYNMVLEFTEQVNKVRHGKNPSKLAIDVANYIQHHMSEPISTEAMAKELYLSRTHLSAKFRAETGMTLTDFILTEKTEEAKRLLRYSDKSVSAISAYLGFSSSSHFSRVFRKYAGVTPNEYRVSS